MPILLWVLLAVISSAATLTTSLSAQINEMATAPLVANSSVLGEADVNVPIVFSVNVPAVFNQPLTAPNVLYSLTAGEGVSVTEGQTPTISNTGVLSLQEETGELELVAGAGISLDGLKITSTITQGYTSLSAGTGISVDGNKVTNADLGSSQSIFKTLSVSGQSDVVADGNSDTLTLIAGSGLTLTTSASGDSVTITPNDPSVAAGWTHTTGLVALTTSSDSVSISGGLNVNSSGITNAGSITGATGFTSSGTITLADLTSGIIHSNIYGVLSSSAVALGGSDVSGTLGATNGGTGLTSYTTGDLIYASATNTLAKRGAGGDGQFLSMSSGVPTWATISNSDPCPTCLVNNPGSDQTITPTAGTGLIIKKASSGTSDIFKVTSADGLTAYLKVESDGDVLLGNGQTTQGVFTVSPTGTHPMTVSPSAAASTAYTGTLTTSDLTDNRTWTFPDATGIVCTTSGNCSGSSSALGGSGTTNYLSKWSSTYSLGNSLLYDSGTNVGIGTTNPGYKLDVLGTASVSAALSTGDTFNAKGPVTFQNTLNVTGSVDLASTLGVTGATTLSSTLGVTGNATFNGNVGIGINNPGVELHISDTSSDGKLRVGGPNVYWEMMANDSGSNYVDILYKVRTNPYAMRIGMEGAATGMSSGKGLQFGYFGTGGTENVSLTTNNINRLSVTSTGLVGIGTTAPTSKLHVSGAVTGKALTIFDETGDQNILVASASGTNRLVLTNAGRLGIGTTAPTAALTVSGNIVLLNHEASITNSGGDMIIGTSNQIYLERISTGLGIGFGTSGPQSKVGILGNAAIGDTYGTAAAPTSGLLVEGNIGIGTTTPTSKLHVSGAVTGKALAIFDETGDQNLLVASASGTTKFVVNHSGNVGIGVSNPSSYALQVSGTIWGTILRTGSDIYIEGATDTLRSISYLSNGPLGIGTNNTERVRISKDGLVGLGTTAPTSKLHVSGAVTGKALAIFDETGDQALLTASASGVTKFLIDHSGNVGIGSTSTDGITHSLDVGGVIRSNNVIAVNNTQYFGVSSGGDDYRTRMGQGYVGTAAYVPFSIKSDGSTRIYLDEVGKIGIGTTAPTSKLHVSGKVTGKALAIFDETGNQALLTASASGVTKFTIGNDGTVTTTLGTGTVYSNVGVLTNTDPSDASLKQNVLTLSDGTLGKVLGLRAVSYEWKRDGTGALGFIAQEVQDVFPELVGSNQDGTLGLYTTQFIPVLTKAIQEQQLQIDEIKLSSASANISQSDWSSLITLVDTLVSKLDAWATKFTTKQLCIDDETGEVCITKTDLQNLLDNLPSPTPSASSSASPVASPSQLPIVSPSLTPSPTASDSAILSL